MDDSTLDRMRRDQSYLLDALQRAGAKINGKPKSFCCPYHDDKHPSAGIYQKDGHWRFKCMVCGVGGDAIDLLARLENKTVEQWLKDQTDLEKKTGKSTPRPTSKPAAPANTEPPPKIYPSIEAILESMASWEKVWDIEATYRYTNPATKKIDMAVIRWVTAPPELRKQFLQVSPVDGGFCLKAPPKPWPIYNRTRLATADQVLFVEGEKCVHAATEIGLVATTTPGGSQNAASADYSPLAGKKVVIWPDNDAPGAAYAAAVADHLLKLDPLPTVSMIDVKDLGLPDGGDIVEYLAGLPKIKGAGLVAVQNLMADARSLGADREVFDWVEAVQAGLYSVIDLPWSGLGELTQALLPGTVTVLAGDPGDGKSLMILQAMIYFFQSGHKIALFELEDDRRFHLMRALAMVCNNSRIVNPKFIRESIDEAQTIIDNHRDFMARFGSRIFAAPDVPQTMEQLGEWVEARAAEHCRIIAIDPITAGIADGKQWIEDANFMLRSKVAIRKSGSSLIVITHPKQGNRAGKPISLSDIAGGAAFTRFAQTVLSLRAIFPPEAMNVRDFVSQIAVIQDVNRTVFINKARNSTGSGRQIAFHFEPKTFRFSELGEVEKD